MQTINPYGGFKLDKNELYKLFYLIYNNPTFKKKDLLLESGFGDNKIENLKNYLKHLNLLDKLYKPTELGKTIYTNDKYFEDEITLWILFYHWAEKTSNPFLFYHLNESNEAKTKEDLRRDFCTWSMKNEIKTEYKKDYLGGLIAITLNSYLDTDAFKNLNIFKIQNDRYYRDIPYKANVLLLAYILYDNRNGRTTITFTELLEDSNNIGKVFNLNKETLLEQIYALRNVGLLKYVQTANLHHIVYTFQEAPLKLLDKYYGQY
jgi:hypothetical protein